MILFILILALKGHILYVSVSSGNNKESYADSIQPDMDTHKFILNAVLAHLEDRKKGQKDELSLSPDTLDSISKVFYLRQSGNTILVFICVCVFTNLWLL